MAGCSLDKSTKVTLLTQSLRISSMAGVKVAVAKNPTLNDAFLATADIIDKVIDGSKSTTDISAAIEKALKDNIKEEYKALITISISESVNLLASILEANKEAIGEDFTAIQTISKGLTAGIRLAVSGQTVAISPEQKDYLKL